MRFRRKLTEKIVINFFMSFINRADYRSLRYLLATLKANEVRITIMLVKNSLNKTTFGPSLSGEVVTTINIPMMPKAMDAQTNTFGAILCIRRAYQ